LDKEMAVNYLKSRVNDLSEKEKSQIIKYALKYPPRVRALLGALLSDVGYAQNVIELRKSLNPLTVYKFGIKREWLSSAPMWSTA